MDTLTHSVIGALLARSCTKADIKKSYLLITALAAAFPDMDYLFFWLNPYKFITEWHRGLTHSLLMLPLWATMMSMAFYQVMHQRPAFTKLFICCCLGLLSHIAIDLMTLYGVQLFAPLSNRRYALSIVFDIDPWIGLLALSSIIFGFYQRRFARFGLLVILIYLLAVFNLQQDAKRILQSSIGIFSKVAVNNYAIPQPFFPFHWKLVIAHHDYYEIAHLSLFPGASIFINKQLKMAQAYSNQPISELQEKVKNKESKTVAFNIPDLSDYRSANRLEWKITPKFGNTKMVNRLARQVWQHAAFAEFRNFSTSPALYRFDHDSNSQCAWFTDLRFVFPMMIPPFRYGMCRHDQHDEWKLFRLRRHSENSRQRIKS